MLKDVRFGSWMLAGALAVLVLAACGGGSPEERVAKLRTYYEANVNGFILKQEPLPIPDDIPPEVAVAPSAMVAPVEGEEPAAEMPPVPTTKDVLLDILVKHDSPEKLPGITLDISMVDAAKNPKGSWKHWVDTSKLPKGNHLQFTYTLEDVAYVDGDGFSAEVRHPIPPAERGDYQEFSVSQ